MERGTPQSVEPRSIALDLPSAVAEGQAADLGQSLGEYRILREVGRGGMGIVYEAEHSAAAPRTGWRLKVINPRFRSEAAVSGGSRGRPGRRPGCTIPTLCPSLISASTRVLRITQCSSSRVLASTRCWTIFDDSGNQPSRRTTSSAADLQAARPSKSPRFRKRSRRAGSTRAGLRKTSDHCVEVLSDVAAPEEQLDGRRAQARGWGLAARRTG